MYLRSIFSVILLLLFVSQVLSQSPQSTIQKHYQAAEAHRKTGNFAAAEAEFAAILAEGYSKLGKIYSVQKEYKEATPVFESATRYQSNSDEVLVDLAISYFETEQYTKALEPLDKALSLNAQSIGAHHMLGKTYFMLGQYEKSVNELETALKVVPNDYDVAYTLGLSYLKQQKLAPAKQIYDRMLKEIGARPQLHIIFGRAYRETNFWPEAIEEFKKAIALEPRYPRAHYYLGLTYLLKDGMEGLNDAANEFKVELTTRPEEFFANYFLGVIYMVQRKFDLAANFLQKASQIQPNNPDTYFHLGNVYQAIDKHNQAIEALRKSIALTPRLDHNNYQIAAVRFRLGQSLLKVGKKEEGEKELQLAAELKSKFLAKDREKVEAYLNSTNLNERDNKFPEMVSTEGVIAESKPLDEKTKRDLKSAEIYYKQVIASAHNNIGLLRAEQQDFRAAAEQFSMAAKWNPQLEGVTFNWGLASYKAAAYKDAIEPLEMELTARPNNIQAKQLLGLSYFMEHNYAKASQLLTEIVTLKPNNVGLNYALALSLINQGKKNEANQIIQQMVKMNDNSPQLHIVLGQAHYEEGNTAKALEELKTALSLDSKTLLAHYYSGLIYLKDGKFDEAAREFESELILNPNDAQAKYHLGFVFLSRRELDRGINMMREVIRLKPDYAEANYELGKALLQKGSIKEAVEHLETAAKLAPDKSYIHYQLGRAYQAAGRKAEGESHLEIYKRLKEKERNPSNK